MTEATPTASAPTEAPAASQPLAQPAPQSADTPPDTSADTSGPKKTRGQRGGARQRPAPRNAPREVHPVLHTLYELHPLLFGARFLPLKLGVFEDLITAHPDRLKVEDLKVALGLHTRSNRYLEAVASGLPRHDLQGQPTEPVAPEHVHHAILELYRRKSNTPQEPAARAKAVTQLTAAIQASGLGREAYRERFGAGGNEVLRGLVEEALAAVAQGDAKREALVRAFRASGASVESFADMYGLDPAEVARFVEAAAPQ